MKDLIEKIRAVVLRGDRVNYRDRRAHYASGNLSCLRDQYWSWKKEPETNPTDFKGAMKMLVGSAVEEGLVKVILSKLGPLGYHLRGTQIAVGGSNPDWDGYLDGLVAKQNQDGVWEQFVVEIKTKSGYGADLFARQPEPSLEYMTQLGLYLKDLHEKKVTNKGIFLYMLMSDNTFGDLVIVNVEYDPKTNRAFTTGYIDSNGNSGHVPVEVDLTAALERWKKLNEFLAKNEVPAGEYQYKYPLTLESVRDIADAKLKKIIDGAIVFGDWQPLYSRYKNKQLEVDGLTPERTPDELKVAVSEYRRRHPRSKI
jgi:hypothetical protein